MYRTQIVLELLVLFVGISHSWDIAVTHRDLLEFYSNKIKTRTIQFDSFTRALAYDEVHDRLLYVKNNNEVICGYNILLNTEECLPLRDGRNIHGLAFDPITKLVFISDTNERSIISFFFKHDHDTHLVIKLDDGIPKDIAIDSCRGYVYWITTNLPTPKIERVRFDGSEREVILNLNSLYTNSYYKLEPHSLVIDQGTQKMYWMEPWNSTLYNIYYADLDGGNKITKTSIIFYNFKFTNPPSNTITVSETALYANYWCSNCERQVLKLGKKEYVAHETVVNFHVTNQEIGIVAKHQMRIQDIKNCEALKCLEEQNSVEPYCVHGEKVFGRCLCKCAPGYIGKRCDVSVCDNYCIQGSCSVNDEGLPKCSCNSGYSGERCGNSDGLYCVHGEKVIGQSVCKCVTGYIGERCEVSVCDNYCLEGNCSVSNDGLPKCRCNAGYSGERCENSDGLYCVHGEKVTGQSVCTCLPGYIGERCDVSVCGNYCFHGNCSINDEGLPKCRCDSGYSGERCEIVACHGFCLNNGACILNEEDEPSCECPEGYEGSRCEISLASCTQKN